MSSLNGSDQGRHSRTINWDEYIRLSLDYGTGEVKLAIQHIRPGIPAENARIENVILSRGWNRVGIPQIGVSLDDNTFKWGESEVEEWLGKHPRKQNSVISGWKMALAPQFRDREVVVRTINTLFKESVHSKETAKDKSHESILHSIQTVITAHLRHIKSECLEWCKNDSFGNHGRSSDWENLPWEIQICVPVSWDEDAPNVMFCAAECAGFNRANIREEAQCVAGAYMEMLWESKHIKKGDVILFFDIGAGTTDASFVRLVVAPSEKVRMKIERVGSSKGNQGGAFFLNNEAATYFATCREIMNEGGLVKVLRKFGTTAEEYQRQVFSQVENIKKTFQNEEVQRWHDKWVGVNVALLDELMATKTPCRTAILTGGGSKNTYLYGRLKAELEDHAIHVRQFEIENPCARGALKHYLFEEDRPLENGRFYITQDQEWNAALHPGYVRYRDKYDREVEYYEALEPIMKVVDGKDTKAHPAVPMRFIVPEDGVIHVNIYCTTKEPYPEPSSPLLDPATKKPIAGLAKYPVSFFDPSALHRFHPKKGKMGERYREVCGFVEMEKVGTGIDLIIKFMRPGFRFSDSSDGQTYREADVAFQQRRQIWDSSRSHFVKHDAIDDTESALRTLDDGRGTTANSDSLLDHITRQTPSSSDLSTPDRSSREIYSPFQDYRFHSDRAAHSSTQRARNGIENQSATSTGRLRPASATLAGRHIPQDYNPTRSGEDPYAVPYDQSVQQPHLTGKRRLEETSTSRPWLSQRRRLE